uniref:MROH2B-like HEAT-repeats domain-containing protein n=1 Tax=Moschus moschiferus TaxID=68415 RepID=A0A8C6E1R5_MOSMO
MSRHHLTTHSSFLPPAQELEEAYQDAASNLLVAICRHTWRVVAQHLETEVLSGVFPHRSFFYVMGIMASDKNLFKEGEKADWEEQLAKAFLFIYYGLMLQAEENGTAVRTHLKTLLETSHQWPKQREGIALTLGMAAARHLDHVWAVLEQFGKSTRIGWSLNSFSPKVLALRPRGGSSGNRDRGRGPNSEDLRWKWASSTILLAYGQMADKARAHILPWVDNILSRMIFFFHYSSWVRPPAHPRAHQSGEGAQSYKFLQVSELLECLMLLMEKEPQDTLCTPTRQQTIRIIISLCKLRPPLDLMTKSRLLSVSLRSVMSLPLLEALEEHTCLFLEPPKIQVRAWHLHPFRRGSLGKNVKSCVLLLGWEGAAEAPTSHGRPGLGVFLLTVLSPPVKRG